MGESQAAGAAPRAAAHRTRTTKGARRREAILAAAPMSSRLVARNPRSRNSRAAAGVSGPAIYRYFASKHELLARLIEDAAVAWRETVDEVLSQDTPPLVTLERLIDAAVALQLESGNLRVVYYQELRSLDDEARRRLARIDRVTMAEWVHLLCEVRPGLTDDEARAAVVMVDGLLRSVASFHTSLDPEQLAAVMKRMAIGGLMALGDARPVASA